MKTKKASRLLKCARRHVRWLIEKGHLKATKKSTDGGRPYWDIPMKSVEELARKRKIELPDETK